MKITGRSLAAAQIQRDKYLVYGEQGLGIETPEVAREVPLSAFGLHPAAASCFTFGLLAQTLPTSTPLCAVAR